MTFANLLTSFGFIRTGTINVSKLARSSLLHELTSEREQKLVVGADWAELDIQTNY